MSGVVGLALTVMKIGVTFAALIGVSAAFSFYHGYSKGGKNSREN